MEIDYEVDREFYKLEALSELLTHYPNHMTDGLQDNMVKGIGLIIKDSLRVIGGVLKDALEPTQEDSQRQGK